MELDKREKGDPEHSDSSAANPLTSGATFTGSSAESRLEDYGRFLREERQKLTPISPEEFGRILEILKNLSPEKK